MVRILLRLYIQFQSLTFALFCFVEIAEANSVNISELRHQETDADRTKKPEWLVMLGVCTHLGCVPIGEGMGFQLLCRFVHCNKR